MTSNHANTTYGDGGSTSSTSYGFNKDEEPLEKGSSEKEKKYLMTKPQRKYMTRNSAGCLVATLCIAMLILVLGAIALFIWLFICKFIMFFSFMSSSMSDFDFLIVFCISPAEVCYQRSLILKHRNI